VAGSTFAPARFWPQAADRLRERETGEEDPDDDDDDDRWLAVWCEGSNQGYRDMVAFIETVADDDRADRLSIAITGRGCVSAASKDVLDRWPDDFERWHVYSGERQRGSRPAAWLAAGRLLAQAHHRPTLNLGRSW